MKQTGGLLSYFGDSTNNDPFGANGASTFNSFVPPEKPKRSNKTLLIVIASLGGLLTVGAMVSGVIFAVSHFGSTVGSSSSAGQKGAPNGDVTGSDSSAPIGSGDTTLDALNAAGSIFWAADSFGYLGINPPIATYLSDSGSDGSSCALWIYGSKSEALAASESNDFANATGGITWGDSSDGSLGYILVADSQSTECATQAFGFLGLN